jgi:hypothetical protein
MRSVLSIINIAVIKSPSNFKNVVLKVLMIETKIVVTKNLSRIISSQEGEKSMYVDIHPQSLNLISYGHK